MNTLKYLHLIYQPPHFPIPVHHHPRSLIGPPPPTNGSIITSNQPLALALPPPSPTNNNQPNQFHLHHMPPVHAIQSMPPTSMSSGSSTSSSSSSSSSSPHSCPSTTSSTSQYQMPGPSTGVPPLTVMFPTSVPMTTRHHHQNHSSKLNASIIFNSGNNNEAQQFLSRGGPSSVIVRMRGLPYDCSGQQVVSFILFPTFCCLPLTCFLSFLSFQGRKYMSCQAVFHLFLLFLVLFPELVGLFSCPVDH